MDIDRRLVDTTEAVEIGRQYILIPSSPIDKLLDGTKNTIKPKCLPHRLPESREKADVRPSCARKGDMVDYSFTS